MPKYWSFFASQAIFSIKVTQWNMVLILQLLANTKIFFRECKLCYLMLAHHIKNRFTGCYVSVIFAWNGLKHKLWIAVIDFINTSSCFFNKMHIVGKISHTILECMFKHAHFVKSVQIWSFFWSVFSCIRTEYWDLRSKSPYSVWIQENTEQKKLRIWTLFTQWQKQPKSFFWFICIILTLFSRFCDGIHRNILCQVSAAFFKKLSFYTEQLMGATECNQEYFIQNNFRIY